jgi:hypothetical protein
MQGSAPAGARDSLVANSRALVRPGIHGSRRGRAALPRSHSARCERRSPSPRRACCGREGAAPLKMAHGSAGLSVVGMHPSPEPALSSLETCDGKGRRSRVRCPRPHVSAGLQRREGTAASACQRHSRAASAPREERAPPPPAGRGSGHSAPERSCISSPRLSRPQWPNRLGMGASDARHALPDREIGPKTGPKNPRRPAQRTPRETKEPPRLQGFSEWS